jgi:hypothetical protein
LNWVTPSTIQPNTTYNVNDALQDAAGSWRNILSYTTGPTPTVPSQDSTHWTFVAQQGQSGTNNVKFSASASTSTTVPAKVHGGDGLGGRRCWRRWVSDRPPIGGCRRVSPIDVPMHGDAW